LAGTAQRRAAERDERGRRRPQGTPTAADLLDGESEYGEYAQQGACVHHAGDAGIGVSQPLESRCAAAEKRDGVAAAGVAERQVGQVSDRYPGGAAPLR
jgi:hypothetical protein